MVVVHGFPAQRRHGQAREGDRDYSVSSFFYIFFFCSVPLTDLCGVDVMDGCALLLLLFWLMEYWDFVLVLC